MTVKFALPQLHRSGLSFEVLLHSVQQELVSKQTRRHFVHDVVVESLEFGSGLEPGVLEGRHHLLLPGFLGQPREIRFLLLHPVVDSLVHVQVAALDSGGYLLLRLLGRMAGLNEHWFLNSRSFRTSSQSTRRFFFLRDASPSVNIFTYVVYEQLLSRDLPVLTVIDLRALQVHIRRERALLQFQILAGGPASAGDPCESFQWLLIL